LHNAAPYFIEAGFIRGAMGLQATFPRAAARDASRESIVESR